jgi:hypothetical protein
LQGNGKGRKWGETGVIYRKSVFVPPNEAAVDDIAVVDQVVGVGEFELSWHDCIL